MKATKNMNIAEIKTALDKYTAKHPVTDKFDLQGLQLCEYAENIKAAVQSGNDEALMQTIADIFNYGYMNGTKQAIKSESDKHNEIFNRSEEKHHKDLVELAYYLPAGIGADCLYMYSVVSLNRYYGKSLIDLLPLRQRRLCYKTLEAYEQQSKAYYTTYNKPLPSYFWVTVFVLHIAGIMILIF